MMSLSFRTLRRPIISAIALAGLCVPLAGCFGGGGDENNDVAVVPTPTPTPTTARIDVGRCLSQEVAPGVTVARLAIPDVLNIDPNAAPGFPNGRMLPDPVVDVIFAVLFLDINAAGQSPLTLANVPLNPPANDVPFPADFPFLAGPQGAPPIAPSTGTNFNFRTDPAADFVRVDRMGFPALSTALVSPNMQNAYNDAFPANDVNGDFVPVIGAELTALTVALEDDLLALNLNLCAD